MSLFPALSAIALHELAHAAMATALGLRIKRVGISWAGPYLVREPGRDPINLAVTLAGPLLNLLLAVLCFRVVPEFAIANGVLGLTNLLPIRWLDGGRALRLCGVRG